MGSTVSIRRAVKQSMSEIIAKILVSITGIFGLVGILYIFGSGMISTGATISNGTLVADGFALVFLGTIVLALILILKRR